MKKIAYSILDLAIVSQGNTFTETFNNSLELAQESEKVGYKRYWLAEHHNSEVIGSSATSILIGKIAEGTKHIRVGSGGIMLPNHSPLIIAEQFGTLGTLYPDRIDLGLGRAPGTDPETSKAIRSDFYKAVQDFPEEVQKIQNYFSYENTTEKVRAPMAEGLNVPLYILGSSTDSAHIAAKKGLPYAFASHFSTAQLMNAAETYQNEFQPSTTLKKPYILAGVNIIVADTDEEAERISTSLYKTVMGIISGKSGSMEAPVEMTDNIRELKKNPAVNQVLKYSFIGSKETVKNEIKVFMSNITVDELIAVTNIFDKDDRLKSYRLFSEIMRELNRDTPIP
tara:strand:- start:7914 stop:8930 length:1017 start_codon:yes stop_codon:yes gene_type:complete